MTVITFIKIMLNKDNFDSKGKGENERKNYDVNDNI